MRPRANDRNESRFLVKGPRSRRKSKSEVSRCSGCVNNGIVYGRQRAFQRRSKPSAASERARTGIPDFAGPRLLKPGWQSVDRCLARLLEVSCWRLANDCGHTRRASRHLHRARAPSLESLSIALGDARQFFFGNPLRKAEHVQSAIPEIAAHSLLPGREAIMHLWDPH